MNVLAKGKDLDTSRVLRLGLRQMSYTVCHTVTSVDLEWYGGQLITTLR